MKDEILKDSAKEFLDKIKKDIKQNNIEIQFDSSKEIRMLDNYNNLASDIALRYLPVVRFRVRKAFGSEIHDYEDIVNEIITNVIEKIRNGEFRGDSSIGTFIYTLTSKRILDIIRAKQKVYGMDIDKVTTPSVEVNAKKEKRVEGMARLIEKLKPKYKEVLYLYYYKDLSREEVAHKIGITPNEVSFRLHYAHKQLIKKLKKEKM